MEDRHGLGKCKLPVCALPKSLSIQKAGMKIQSTLTPLSSSLWGFLPRSNVMSWRGGVIMDSWHLVDLLGSPWNEREKGILPGNLDQATQCNPFFSHNSNLPHRKINYFPDSVPPSCFLYNSCFFMVTNFSCWLCSLTFSPSAHFIPTQNIT